MFTDNGEPAPDFRDSETSKDTNDKNRYTKVDDDILFNPVEGLDDDNKEEGQKENQDNKDNENIVQSVQTNNSSNSKKKKETKQYKIIVLGEKGVGKTCLINRYIFNKFILSEKQNSEVNIKKIDIDDNASAELSIYDTTNEQKLGKITKNYYKDAYGAIIVFDLTNKNSFNKVKYWLKEINSNAPKDIVICLLGNKADITHDRNVAYEDAKALAEDNLYYEVSAKSGNNVSLAFEQLTYGIIEKQNEEEDNPEKERRGKEGRRTADLNDINMINKELSMKKKCC